MVTVGDLSNAPVTFTASLAFPPDVADGLDEPQPTRVATAINGIRREDAATRRMRILVVDIKNQPAAYRP